MTITMIVIAVLIAGFLLVCLVLGYVIRKRVRLVRLEARQIHESWDRNYQPVEKPGSVLATSDWLIEGSGAETQFREEAERRSSTNGKRTHIQMRVVARKRVARSKLPSAQSN